MSEVPKLYKVHMNQEAYSILQIEAALRNETLKDAVSRLVIAGASPKTIAAMKAAQSTNEAESADVPNSTDVLKGTIEQSLQEPKSPLPILPQSLELLSSDEKVALEHLQAGKTYREIQELEKGKTNLTKGRVQTMVQKFIGMGLYQKGKRGPKAKP